MTPFIQDPAEGLIHGCLVRDPFRWLEDRNLSETEDWIRNQERNCGAYFAQCGDLPAIRQRVKEYLDVDTLDQPTKIGRRYFYRRRNRGQEQAGIYLLDTGTGLERSLANSSSEGPFTSLGIHRVCEDGSLLAYELRQGGTNRKELHFVDVVSGELLPDRIPSGYLRGFCFTAEREGYCYVLEDETHSGEHVIQHHHFGSGPLTDDQIIFHVPRSQGSRLILTSDNTRLGAIHLYQANHMSVCDFWVTSRDLSLGWSRVIRAHSLPYTPFLHRGRIFVMSYESASGGELRELDLGGIETRVIVPEQDALVRQLVVAGSDVFVQCLKNMVPSIRRWSLTGGRLHDLDIPVGGTINLLSPTTQDPEQIFYTFQTYTEPLTTFEYNLTRGTRTVWHRTERPHNTHQHSVSKTEYLSRDGTKVPLTLISADPSRYPGARPCVMTSYGGFGIPMTPQFSVLANIMRELGVVFALPHIRGGGEFGRHWHEAAKGRLRQNAFDDFIGAAQWLCDSNVTTARQLGIFGGSNSGLLVGVAVTQKPELFGAAICIAPLLDMVRYESFDDAAQWRSEYGTVADPDDFAALRAYSPYHCVLDDTNYPPLLFVAGDSDDRCNPVHARKMVARLQERKSQKHPIILDYSQERGHATVLPLSVRVEALARRIAFLSRELGICVKHGGPHDMARP